MSGRLSQHLYEFGLGRRLENARVTAESNSGEFGQGPTHSRRPHGGHCVLTTSTPSQVADRATVIMSPSMAATVACNSSRAPPSCGTTTGAENRTENDTMRPGSPSHSDQQSTELGLGVHAVGDDVGQSDLRGHGFVPVDRAEVATGPGVHHQVDAFDLHR